MGQRQFDLTAPLGGKGVWMGKLELRTRQPLPVEIKEADRLFRNGQRERNPLPFPGQELFGQPGQFRLGILHSPPQPGAVAGYVELRSRRDGPPLRGGQRRAGTGRFRLQRLQLPAAEKRQLVLLGQTGHEDPGRLDQLHSRPQNGALRLPAVLSTPPLRQIGAEIGPVCVPK